MAKNRPTGVTIASILGFIQGILQVIFSLGTVITSVFLGSLVSSLGGALGSSVSNSGVGLGALSSIFGGLFIVTGIVFLIAGLLVLLAFYWVWGLKKKGFLLALVLEAITLLGGLFSLVIAFNIATVATLILPLTLIILLWINKKAFK